MIKTYTIDTMNMKLYNKNSKNKRFFRDTQKELVEVETITATHVRNEWSAVVDSVIREKPRFIKRTRDYMMLSDINVVENMLSAYVFTAEKFIEPDGSVTLGLNEIDLVENAQSEESAIVKMAHSILEYAEDYYSNFALWYAAPNRKQHLPYVIKALIINDTNKIGEMITCHHGKI